NDVEGISVNLPEAFEIPEGQISTLNLKLNTQPKKDVKITLSTSDDTEAEFTEKDPITLTADNWNTGAEIHLEAVKDYFIDGDQPVKVTFKVESEDEGYSKLGSIEHEGKILDTDTAEVVYSLGSAPTVKEGDGSRVTMSVTLSSKPTKDVTVDVSVSDSTEISVNKSKLTIKAAYWDLPQDIDVSSVDDDILDGNTTSQVILKTTSGDANFENKTTKVDFMTVDNDEAGFVIASNASSFSENSNATTSMTIALKSQPTADVKVHVTSTDSSELAVTSSSPLTFTEKNWKDPQTVTVKVVDDYIPDGTQTAKVKFKAESGDSHFNGYEDYSAEYTIIDNDSVSVVLTTASTSLVQGASSTTGSVVLSSQPSANVTVKMVASNSSYISFSQPTLTFTSQNWNKPQSFTVTGNLGNLSSSMASVNIYGQASGGDYANVKSNVITMNLVKMQTQTFKYEGKKIQSVLLPTGRYKLEVWGAQGGSKTGGVGGKGGYAAGTIQLTSPTTVYVAVGQTLDASCESGSSYSAASNHVFNGGGCGSNPSVGLAGGGATHMALASGELHQLSASSVLLVAGGGGGGSEYYKFVGGYGGGTIGGDGKGNYNTSQAGYGATQTSGGVGAHSKNGSFGLGGTSWGSSYTGSGGGGGGWYGGGAASNGSGGGGSGYINTSRVSTIQLTGGNASFTAYQGGLTTGNAGSGYARITPM
ncbi:MAG: hypothetical protein IKY68_03840, partial [Alistipes sp.]|nr:hypothetical protein [Alistipes sp.]